MKYHLNLEKGSQRKIKNYKRKKYHPKLLIYLI